jgi:vancomycin resistance protein VanJ
MRHSASSQSSLHKQLPSVLKTATTALVGAYLLGIAVYLILRLTFGDRFWWLAFINDFAPLVFLLLPSALTVMWWFRLRWLTALALIICCVVVLWFGPRFLPRRLIVSSESKLDVVTFNVWGNNTRLNRVQEWLSEREADIVLLQEIPDLYADHQIPELVLSYPFQMSQPTSVRRWGNMILSRHPILSVEDLPGEGVPAQQRLLIDWNDQILAVYNVHFAMPIGASRIPELKSHFILQIALSYDASARNAEITRLLARLRTEPYPYIVVGDFNMSEYAAIYKNIAETMTDAYREVNNGWGGTWPISVVEELPRFVPPLLRVDYVWHSDHFQAVEVRQGPPLGSDHLPLYTSLAFSPVQEDISQCTN